MPRDLVRFAPNIRVDLPEMVALQRNARSDGRAGMRELLRAGSSVSVDLHRILEGFKMEENGVPDSNLVVNRGSAVGAETLEDGTVEYGVVYGHAGPAQILTDFAVKAPGVYDVYVRFVQTLGQPGTRIFWNDDLQEEEAQSLDTRYVATWQVTVLVSGSPSPGLDYIKLGEVAWGGATIVNANISDQRHFFFEGSVDSGYAYEWGDGVNDRNAARSEYGVHDLWTFAQAVRRQLRDIVDPLFGEWYEAPFVSLREHFEDGVHNNARVLGNLAADILEAGFDGIPGAGTPYLRVQDTGGGPFFIGPKAIFDASSLAPGGSTEFNGGFVDFVFSAITTFDGSTTVNYESGHVTTFESGTLVDVDAGAQVDMYGDLIAYIGSNWRLPPNNTDFTVTKNVYQSWAAGAIAGLHETFSADYGLIDVVDTGSRVYISLAGTNTGPVVFWVPITGFVDGTTLDQVEAYCDRQTAGSTLDIEVYYQNHGVGVYTPLGSASAGAGLGPKSPAVSSIGHVMDLTNRAYYVKVILDNGTNPPDAMRLSSIRIRGNMDSLFPA